MAIVNLPHKRVGNDIKLTVQVLDNGVALDWSSVTRIYASLQSDSQHVRMGLCVVEGPDSQDQTKLRLLYPAKSPQYAGVARLVLECNYMGHTSTLDTPAFVFVPSTAEEGTGPVDVEISASVDPETNDLQILVTDVDTSVLDDAIQAANDAADAANEAADNANESVSHFTGGTTGQVLSKKSNADYDFEWQDAGGVGAPVWGNITGTLSAQTDLQDALDAKQATISDLSDIRSGAEAGASAVQGPVGLSRSLRRGTAAGGSAPGQPKPASGRLSLSGRSLFPLCHPCSPWRGDRVLLGLPLGPGFGELCDYGFVQIFYGH